MNIRISGTIDESIVDGTGIRFVLFTQGCPHGCKECHNPDTHNYNGGFITTTEDIITKFENNPLVSGITISGGEPFVQPEAVLDVILRSIKLEKDIWIFTGYTFDELLSKHDDTIIQILKNTDVLVDGRFELDKKDLTLRFRGSQNQRLINAKQSILENTIVLHSLEA